jgi:hypothetical protein
MFQQLGRSAPHEFGARGKSLISLGSVEGPDHILAIARDEEFAILRLVKPKFVQVTPHLLAKHGFACFDMNHGRSRACVMFHVPPVPDR